jgi:hypothetical protein
MAPRRPSAFDVSFPDEATSPLSSTPPPGQSVSSGSASGSPSASSSNLKRKSDAHGPGESRVRASHLLTDSSRESIIPYILQAAKQLQLPPGTSTIVR